MECRRLVAGEESKITRFQYTSAPTRNSPALMKNHRTVATTASPGERSSRHHAERTRSSSPRR